MRYATDAAESVLIDDRHMAFVSGPRQVGKTTLARDLLRRVGCDRLYFNWDVETDRRAILREPSDFVALRVASLQERPRVARVVLDEIHKYPRWKRLLKGLFDAHRHEMQIVVTGSGQLDVYQRGGDSLVGRYDAFRLHPFTLGEHLAGGRQRVLAPARFVEAVRHADIPAGAADALATIERFTGFPEPLHAARDAFLRRWRRSVRQLVLREDLRDLTRIRDLGSVEQLVSLLPERTGSLLSVNALSEDLGVAFNTTKLWLEALARLYVLFELRPHAGKLARTLRREGKVYLYDFTGVPEPGARFESVVALHLRKLCDAWTDTGEGDFDLRYVRDKEKREVDFLITESRKPWLLLETKLTDRDPAPALGYFAERLRPAHGAVQIVRTGLEGPLRRGDAYVVPAESALALV